MKKYGIVEITVTPKKGEKVKTKWGVQACCQNWPSLTNHSGSIRWVNPLEKLFSADKIMVHVALLKADFTKEAAEGNRLDYAGYGENENILTFRGKELGEVTGTAPYPSLARNISDSFRWSVRGCMDEVRSSEKQFLNEQVGSVLTAWIRDQNHRGILYTQAREDFIEAAKEQIVRNRAAIEKAAAEAEEAFRYKI